MIVLQFNYYRHGVFSKTFSIVDHNIFQALIRLAKRRHPNKSKECVDNKYFTSVEYDNWIFNAGTEIVNGSHKIAALFKLNTTKIVRYVKIRADAKSYDPAYAEYFI